MSYSANQLPSGLDAKTTPIDADVVVIGDSADSNRARKVTWSNVKATLKTYFDTLYLVVGSITSSGLTMTTSRILGRTTASTGAVEELSSVDSFVSAASDTTQGKVELATIAETTTGTDSARAITPDGLAGSTVFGAKTIEIQLVADATDVDTSSGVAYIRIPQSMNGMNLIRAQADVTTAGTTNATTIQIRNMTKYSSNDALSSAISIASGGTLATAGTVNTSYDDVATDDLVKIYVTAQSTTKPKGLRVWMEYQLP